jgi:hypothetical protein
MKSNTPVKLVKQPSEAKLVKPILRNGLLVLPGEVDADAVVRQVKAEREKRREPARPGKPS